MKIISNIIDKSKLNEYLNSSIDIFIVGNHRYSSRHQVDYSIDEIKDLKDKMPKEKQLFVLMNQLYDQSKIIEIEDTMKLLNQCHIDGIIFQDFGLLQLKEELDANYTMFYDPLTLNTNANTLLYLSQLHIDGFFISREISVEDIQEISDKISHHSVVQLDGLRYIAQSKRALLTNYFKAKEIKKDPKKVYSIQPPNSSMVNYIFEDNNGCHIVSKDRLLSYHVIDKFLDSGIKYGYINGLFMDYDQQINIVESYKQLINLYGTSEYPIYLNTLDQQVGDYGFYYDTTVYKLEDVRKRDANERDK